MDSTLNVTLAQTYKREPLAVVDNLPGQGAELTPAQMRGLAQALLAAATDCEAAPMGTRTYRRQRRDYALRDDQ